MTCVSKTWIRALHGMAVPLSMKTPHVSLWLRPMFAVPVVLSMMMFSFFPAAYGWESGESGTYGAGTTVYDVAIRGVDAFCCIEDGLAVVDLTDPSAPVLAGEIRIPGAKTVCIHENRAYVAAPPDGVLILDITTPHNPAPAGTIAVTGDKISVVADGAYVYIASGGPAFTIHDVSDISQPRLISTVETHYDIHSICVLEGHVYIGSEWKMEAYDVTDPGAASLTYSTSFTHSPITRELKIVGTNLLMSDHLAFSVYDLADPSKPNILDFKAVYSTGSDILVKRLCGNSRFLCVLRGAGFVSVFDMTNPEEPVKFPDLWMNMIQSGCGLCDNTLVVAGDKGLRLYDLNTTTRYDIAYTVETPGTACGITGSMRDLYIADGECGVQHIEFDRYEGPVFTEWYDTPGYAHDIDRTSFNLNVADGSGGILLLDRNADIDNRLYMQIDTPEPAVRLGHSSSILLAAGEKSSIYAVPTPEHYGSFTKLMEYETGGKPSGLDIIYRDMLSKYAIVADYNGFVRTVNLVKSGPVYGDCHETYDHAVDVLSGGENTYVLTTSGIEVFNTLDVDNIFRVSSVDIAGDMRRMCRWRNRLYIAAGYDGVIVLDITDRFHPVFLLRADTPGEAMGISASDDFLFVADGACGVQIMRKRAYAPLLTCSYDGPFTAVSVEHDDTASVLPAPLTVTVHPNPFNASAVIGFIIPAAGQAVVDIHAVTGQRIRRIPVNAAAPGMHSVTWDGADDTGCPVSSGVYFARVHADRSGGVSRMLLLR